MDEVSESDKAVCQQCQREMGKLLEVIADGRNELVQLRAQVARLREYLRKALKCANARDCQLCRHNTCGVSLLDFQEARAILEETKP